MSMTSDDGMKTPETGAQMAIDTGAAEDTAAAPKPRRTRAKSTKTAASSDAAKTADDAKSAQASEQEQAKAPAKRATRARKATKSATAASSADAAVSGGEAAPEISDAPKPKRRTRKTTAPKAAEEAAAKAVSGAESAPEPAEAPKPKRRTRKVAAAKAEEAQVAEKPAFDEDAASGSEEAPKPRRRTRKTAAAKAEEEAAGKTAAEVSPETEEAPKPRRRTPKTATAKSEEAAGKEAAAEPVPEAATAPESAEAPKPRRRTRKTAATKVAGEAGQVEKTQAETVDSPASVHVENSESSATAGEQTEPEKPRRRVRVRKAVAKKDDVEAGPSQQEGAAESDTPAASEAPSQSTDGTEKAPEGSDREKTAGDSSDEKPRGESHGRDDHQNDRQGGHNRRRKRRGRNGGRKEIVPSATRDELASLSDEELAERAQALNVDAAEYGERDDLVSVVYDALLQSEGFVMVEGILDLLPDGYGFIRTDGYVAGEHDVYVGVSTVRRNGLRKGDYITGRVRPPRDNEKYPALNTIVTLNDEPFNGPTHRVKFKDLTPVYPDERLIMEHGKDTITARTIDLVSPIGKGQRGLIVSPPKAGKTTILKDIAAAISANNPEVHLMCLLVDERPEEVTDMERSIDGEVVSSTFDMPAENHIAVSELVIERAKRLVENGQDVVILLDSITRLARAYNLAQPASGRILSGGVDSSALYPPKKFLGAARNIEFGGSLTILATGLIETGSKMDEVIFEEFKGTGNMELKLDRSLADKRIFPAIDPVTSGTRKEELLIDAQEAPLIWGVRRLLANMNNTERAMDMLIKSLKQTENNREFLIKSARKANRAAASQRL